MLCAPWRRFTCGVGASYVHSYKRPSDSPTLRPCACNRAWRRRGDSPAPGAPAAPTSGRASVRAAATTCSDAPGAPPRPQVRVRAAAVVLCPAPMVDIAVATGCRASEEMIGASSVGSLPTPSPRRTRAGGAPRSSRATAGALRGGYGTASPGSRPTRDRPDARRGPPHKPRRSARGSFYPRSPAGNAQC